MTVFPGGLLKNQCFYNQLIWLLLTGYMLFTKKLL